MGRLLRVHDTTEIHLPATALIGRDPSYDVVLSDGRASSPHAVLRWSKDKWTLRDLASRNGTFINGKPLPAGQAVTLGLKTTLQFGGHKEEFTLLDLEPPQPLARHLASGRTVSMRDGLLTLPDETRALASIHPSLDDGSQLIVEMLDRVSPAVDREVIELDGEQWQLRTQVVSGQATVLANNTMTVTAIRLIIWASQDMEEITVTVQHRDREIKQRQHAWNELLLVLGRARVRDKDAAPAEQGWIHRDDLCRMLNMPVTRLNVDIHRAREQFRRIGVLPSSALIERRRGPQDIRLGVPQVELLGHARLPEDGA